MTFFGATMIGKALIKAHMQTIFIIILFSDHHVEHLINLIEKYMPFLKNSLSQSLQKQKEKLFHHSTENESKSIIAVAWEIIITLMIVFFLYSIINSVVNEHLKKLHEEENEIIENNTISNRSSNSKQKKSIKSAKKNDNTKHYIKFN